MGNIQRYEVYLIPLEYRWTPVTQIPFCFLPIEPTTAIIENIIVAVIYAADRSVLEFFDWVFVKR